MKEIGLIPSEEDFMIIWRLENERGIGPFMNGDIHFARCDIVNVDAFLKHDPWRIKSVEHDIKKFKQFKHVCGFANLKQFYHFMPLKKSRKNMSEKTRTKLVAYKINKRSVLFGVDQIAFEKSKAIKIKQYPINYKFTLTELKELI